MALYTVNRVKSATLAADTADTITFNHGYPEVEVLHRGASGELSVRADGVTATKLGDDCYVVQAGESLYLPAGRSPTQVSLISSAAVPYTVTGVRE